MLFSLAHDAEGSWVEFEFRRAFVTLSLEVLIDDRRISAARICSCSKPAGDTLYNPGLMMTVHGLV